jgi:LysR family transcriptional regulator, regulator for metE and metH
MLELRHLRTLAALAELGSVSAAASRLHLTQSAVSHQLRALEAHYGVALLDRKRTPLQLSSAGQRLFELSASVLPQIQAAERDLAQATGRRGGSLRIAIECHTCFDWLMPIMDVFRTHWPEVELDLVSGFHSDPVKLIANVQADLAVVSEKTSRRGMVYQPLFRFEILAVMAPGHPLARRRRLRAGDFSGHTLITYPVPDERIDLIRHVLKPAGITVERRTAELTIAILQLVASRRGLAALPNWGLKNYLEHDYVVARPIGGKGLWSNLYAVTTEAASELPYLRDFVETTRNTCFATLGGIKPIR